MFFLKYTTSFNFVQYFIYIINYPDKKVWIVHPHSMTNYSLILFLNNPNKPKPASNIIKAGF